MADQHFDASSDLFLALCAELSRGHVVDRVLPIAIPITVLWISRQLGIKCVFVAATSLCHKPILSTSVVASRQKNDFLVLWTKLKRSGTPRSVEQRK